MLCLIIYFLLLLSSIKNINNSDLFVNFLKTLLEL